MIVTGDARDAQDMGLVKEVLEYLNALYPNWGWFCGVGGGSLIIRSTVINSMLFRDGVKHALSFCEVLQYADVMSDANHRKKQVMRAGGNLLERARKERMARELGDFTTIKGFDASLGGLRG